MVIHVWFSDDYLQRTYNGEEKVFRGDLRADEKGIELIDFDNPDSQDYQRYVSNYTHLIKHIIISSPLQKKFIDAEVISLEP